MGLVALADQQRAALAGRLGGEAAPVDQPGAEGDGVDGEAGPRQVEVRERREHLDLDAVVGDQQLDGPLGDHRRPGHRVEDLAVLGGARATSASTMAA